MHTHHVLSYCIHVSTSERCIYIQTTKIHTYICWNIYDKVCISGFKDNLADISELRLQGTPANGDSLGQVLIMWSLGQWHHFVADTVTCPCLYVQRMLTQRKCYQCRVSGKMQPEHRPFYSEHIELRTKLLEYFWQSDTSNTNQSRTLRLCFTVSPCPDPKKRDIDSLNCFKT